MPKNGYRFAGRAPWLALLVLAALSLSACRFFSSTPEPVNPPPAAALAVTPTAVPTAPGQTRRSEAKPALQPTATPTLVVQPVRPLSDAQAAPPANLRIPAIGLDVLVAPMGWETAQVDGRRTTRWIVPENTAGWHPNTAQPGQAGNVVISGHQLLGAAVFAPLAAGDVLPGHQILLADTEGRTFVYQVVEVTDPLPIPAELEEEQALAAHYTAPAATPSLTLITGWPEFTITHRVMLVAELAGIAE